jgi:hypothetical protein
MSRANHVTRRHFAASALSTAAMAALPPRSSGDAEIQKIKGGEMTTLTPYLLFDDNCHQAMEYYRTCFGGQLTVIKVKDSPARDHMPAEQFEKITNARLTTYWGCGDFRFGLASTGPDTHSWQYGLSLPERREARGVEGSVREAFPGRRCERSFDAAILRFLRGA